MPSSYRWFILALVVLTATVVVAAPMMALPVLFKEISTELGMDLVQIGFIGTMTALTGMVVGLLGGAIGDRFGPRRTLAAACVLTGLTGALRGFSGGFAGLLATTFLFGLSQPVININLSKTCAVWFPARERGTANGGVSVGMALGFLLGSLLSATVLSPLLGGWRNVLFVFGMLACTFGVLWFFTRNPVAEGAQQTPHVQLRAGLRHVMRVRNMWIMGLAAVGYGGCVTPMLAYLPLYLRNIGWTNANADSTVATFHAVSLAGAIPIAMLSDRLRKRRVFLLLGALLMAAGVGALTVAAGVFIVAAVIVAGCMRDGFMAIFMTTVMETREIGLSYTGSAIGFVQVFFALGGTFAPPLGNSLAAIGPAAPFLLWAALAALGLVSFSLLPVQTQIAHLSAAAAD
jgi:cyanate permease